MKKKLLSLLLLTILIMTSACGSDETPSSTAKESSAEQSSQTPEESETNTQTVSMYDLSKAMCGADASLPEMSRISSGDENARELFTYFSKLDYEKVDSYFLSYAAKGTAEEIGVILLKDPADAQDAVASLKDHVKERINLYKSYAPEQVPRAEKADFVTEGSFVALIMCDEQSAVKDAFINFLKGE